MCARVSASSPSPKRKRRTGPAAIPDDATSVELAIEGKTVTLTNLDKLFWPDLKITKRALLQYYLDMAPVLVPHLENRAMVMKRYPNGAYSSFFFMKRAPSPRPAWIEVCPIEHGSGNVVAFPMVNDTATLLWLINLGCIDLNPWYARCDDVNRPDCLYFDLDPVPKADFENVLEVASIVRASLRKLKMKVYAKTTGSRGIHLAVPIKRGPLQKQVWTFAKEVANVLAAEHPKLVTAEYRINKRPPGRILVDYNQNAWGRTLASIYSIRPRKGATVSMPISDRELDRGVAIEDFTIFNARDRIAKLGDLWAPILARTGRTSLEKYL